MTLDQLNEEVQIAIQQVALLVKQVYQIGEKLVEKAESCEADAEDITVAMMTYVAAVKKLHEPNNVH